MWLEPFSLRLETPLETARGRIDERRGLLVGIQESRGNGAGDDAAGDGGDSEKTAVIGLGEATPLPGWTEPFDDCEAALSGLVGDEPATVADESAAAIGDESNAAVDDGSAAIAAILDATGIDPDATPAAAHAVELAILDAHGRRHERPLGALLHQAAFDDHDGGEPVEELPETVPVNATIGDGDVESTVAAAEAAREAGFDCLKCKVGSRDVDDDVERIRAVRAAVGERPAIRVDANGAWGRASAIRAVHALADLDVSLVEQPLPAEDLAGHRELRRRGVDIAVDESLTAYDLDEIIAAEAADAVVCKPMALGGPLRATRAAATALDAGLTPIVTTTIDAVVARTAAVHVASAIPDVSACGLATAALLAEDLASDPVTISEGTASVPAGGGLCGDGFASLANR